MKLLEIGTAPLSYVDYQLIADGSVEIQLSETARKRISASRKFLEEKSLRSIAPIYGVNTGFGRLASHRINESDLATLQLNLIRSHCVGVGEPLGVPVGVGDTGPATAPLDAVRVREGEREVVGVREGVTEGVTEGAVSIFLFDSSACSLMEEAPAIDVLNCFPYKACTATGAHG